MPIRLSAHMVGKKRFELSQSSPQTKRSTVKLLPDKKSCFTAWLGWLESNQQSKGQNLMPLFHLATPQYNGGQ